MIKLFVLLINISMIFFNTTASAKYEKIFYDFKIDSIIGDEINFKDYEGKAILVVNTASYCGFTKQYDDLQSLWEKYKSEGLIVLGIPSNTFNQEKSSEKEIKEFCEVNFNISFPLSKLTEVKGENAHPLYIWAKENHGKSAVPKWNFHKILINKQGKIEDTFSSLTKPLSSKIQGKIKKILE